MAEVLRAGPDGHRSGRRGRQERRPFIGSPSSFDAYCVARLCLGISWAGRIHLRQAIAMAVHWTPSTSRSRRFTRTLLRFLTGCCCLMRSLFAIPQQRWKWQSSPIAARLGRVLVLGPPDKFALVHRGGPDRELGFELLTTTRSKRRERSVRVIGLAVRRHLHRTGDGVTRRYRWCY